MLGAVDGAAHAPSRRSLEGISEIGIFWIGGCATSELHEDALGENHVKHANRTMVCPHCGVAGEITTEQVKMKKGVSGGKATAAVLTLGWSLLATGLSRKAEVTQVHCGHCGMTWHVE